MRKLGKMPEIEEFESKGFVRASKNTNLLRRLRIQYGDNFRIFKCGLKGCGQASSSGHWNIKIFGGPMHFYYDLRRKEEFIKYLIEVFHKENPMEDIKIKKEFTRLLHYHGL